MLLAGTGAGAQNNREQDSLAFARADWQVRELARGVVWKSGRFTQKNALFGAPARIHILRVDQSLAPTHFAVAFYPSQVLPTSEMAARAEALAAVNGTYFQTKPPYGPTGYFKIQGQTVNSLMAATGDMIAIDTAGRLSIERLDKHAVQQDVYPSLMAGAPTLLWEGRCPLSDPDSLRAPRTAVGQRGATIWIVTVDGRSSQAAGMTLWELSQIFRWLGADKALNLDGGGSTTLYIRQGSRNDGVVNTPSDRLLGIFPGMERAVGNALLLLEDGTSF